MPFHHPLLAIALADTVGADAKGPICVSKASSSTKPEVVARAKTTRGEVQQTWRKVPSWPPMTGPHQNYSHRK